MSTPFDDLIGLFDGLAPVSAAAEVEAAEALADKPIDQNVGLGALARKLAAAQGKALPSAQEIHLCLLASSYDKGAPKEAIAAFRDKASKGATPVNLLCVDDGLGLRIMDLAVDIPHKPFGWSEQDTVAATAYGMEATAAQGDILGLGDLAFGNDAYALALAVVVRRGVEDVDGLLNSVADPIRQQAAALIAALPNVIAPLEALQQVGGRDIAAALGAIAASRAMQMPLLVEGSGVLAACAIAQALNKKAMDHVILAGCNSEFDWQLAQRLGLQPLLGQPTGAGPGTALALAARQVRGAIQLFGLRDSR